MTRIDKVYQGLCQAVGLKDEPGITAGELAQALNISRANCSFDLNRLCEQGKAEKKGSKPVYYYPLDDGASRKNPFLSFIQDNPSLTKCGELAKAAVLYPPHGMNILLLGETGVGKSMFAKLIYNFASSLEGTTMPGKFVVFNCADYADNPQLLISQLFGAIKGAYTGADVDREGLIEVADQGILFLDEVHRLPAVGQEMLFTYIDRGVFRRLGETTSERKAQVMLICATTEEPDSVLLQTFFRRLPVVIQLPNLNERSLEERQHLMALFFSQEAVRLNAPILVTVNTLRALLGYSCPGNIGQLSGDIRLLCARAYANYLSGNEEQIRITSYSLPPHIRNGFLNEKSRKELWNKFGLGHQRFYTFLPDGTLPDFKSKIKTDIYDLMEQQTLSMKRVGIPDKDISTEINDLLSNYYQSLESNNHDYAAISSLVGPEIAATTDKMIEKAKEVTGKEFADNISYGLAMHIFHTLKRLKDKKPIEHPAPQDLQQKYPLEWQAALECGLILENDFLIKIPTDEVAFITHFFITDIDTSIARQKVQVIVIAHGNGTATGMADVANHLFDNEVAIGFDMCMSESPEKVYNRVRDYLKERTYIKNILLLVDMGSLSEFAQDLQRDLPLTIRTISLVSTLHVVEASRMAALGHSLDEVYNDTILINGATQTDIAKPVKDPAKLFILTVCSTGIGGASMLRQILEQQLDLVSCRCEIVELPLGNEQDFQAQVKELKGKGRIIAVVSTFKTSLPIMHIALSEVLEGSAIGVLQNRLKWESLRFTLTDTVRDLLDQLNPEAAIEVTHNTVSKLVKDLDIDLSEEMMVGIFSHLLFMLNRLKKGKSAPLYPNKESLQQRYPGVVAKVAKECRYLEKLFTITIPDDEICYIAAFFTKENLLRKPSSWNW